MAPGAMEHAADFATRANALVKARQEGYAYIYPVRPNRGDEPPFYLYTEVGDDGAHRRKILFHELGKWHLAANSDAVGKIPLDVQRIDDSAGEARDYVAVDAHGKRLGVVTRDYAEAKALADSRGGYVQFVDAPETKMRFAMDRRGNVKPLRWHRDKHGLYSRAANGTSSYRIHRREERISRRAKKLPWILTLDGAELRSFEEVAQAKRYAEKHNKTGALLPSAPLAPTMPQSPSSPVAPLCAPFTEVRIDEEKFRACAQLADSIGPITTPQAVYKLLRQYCVSQPQEVFLVVSLDLHGHLRGIDEVARGQIDRVNVGIDDVMRAALGAALARQAKGFAVVHCHPSGKATPSQADKDLTKAIEKARKPFGNNLKLVDHVVIGLDEFSSIKMRKLFRGKR